MKNVGFAIFVIFFGISVFETLSTGQWSRAVLWIGAGVVFWWLGRALDKPAAYRAGVSSKTVTNARP